MWGTVRSYRGTLVANRNRRVIVDTPKRIASIQAICGEVFLPL